MTDTNKVTLKKWGLRLALFVVTTFLLLLSLCIYFVFSIKEGKYGQLPSNDELRKLKNHEASEIYTADGALLGKYYLVNRTNAVWEDISPNIINALIATEDVRFFEHQGVDIRSLVRVMVKSILLQNESSGGGSTISQQLVKNLFGRKKYPHFSMAINKIKESFIASRLEAIYTKNEILTMYLNTVSFGENVYGIEVAAQRYFSSHPKNMSLNEAAILIGMLKATSNYNPRANPENAMRRRNIVLNQMVKYNYLEKEIAEKVKQEPLNLKYNFVSHNDGLAPYFRETIRLELHKVLKENTKADGTAYNLYTDGLKIYTTLNSQMQEYAEGAVNDHIKTLQEEFFKLRKRKAKVDKPQPAVLQAMQRSARYKELKEQNYSEAQITKIFSTPVKMEIFTWNGEKEMVMSPLDSIRYYQEFLSAGFFAMEPETGKVLAWVGGVQYKHFKYDHIRSKRQVGSTFKPIVYAAALENGMEPCFYISNEKETYANLENWSPRNSDGKYDGYYTMQGGLMKSLNTVTTKIMLETGTGPVIKLARKMGISSELPEVPALALGVASISLEEMVSAYTTFPNRGLKSKPVYIERIEDANGNVIVDYSSKPNKKTRAMKESTADIINHFLRSVVDSGTASGIRTRYGLMNEIGGKTGTTQNQADGWFIGYTPNIVVGVWVGHDDPKVHFNTPGHGQGSKMAMPIFANFLKKVLESNEFQVQKKSRFAPLSAELMEKLDCETYMPDPEEHGLFNFIFKNPEKEKPRIIKKRKRDENQPKFFNRIKRIFKK